METNGIRILDNENGFVTVELKDIIEEIPIDCQGYFWSLLWLGGLGLLNGKSIPEYELIVNDSPNGIPITWKEVEDLSFVSSRIYDMVLICCKDRDLLKRYKNEHEMYNTCNIVIIMFDSSYWEVFSKDEQLINRLARKFKEIEFIDSKE